jgi:excinuclease ABC subunit A
VLALPEGTRLYLLAPVVRGRKGEYRKELAEYLKKGFQRVKIDGTFHELASAPTLDKKFPHDIDVVVDRIVVRSDIGQRLAESFETALKLAEGLAVIEYADAPAAAAAEDSKKKTAKIHDKSGPERILFSEKFASPRSSRGCFRSTTPMAPVRSAAASVSSSISTRTSSFPTRR